MKLDYKKKFEIRKMLSDAVLHKDKEYIVSSTISSIYEMIEKPDRHINKYFYSGKYRKSINEYYFYKKIIQKKLILIVIIWI